MDSKNNKLYRQVEENTRELLTKVDEESISHINVRLDKMPT